MPRKNTTVHRHKLATMSSRTANATAIVAIAETAPNSRISDLERSAISSSGLSLIRTHSSMNSGIIADIENIMPDEKLLPRKKFSSIPITAEATMIPSSI